MLFLQNVQTAAMQVAVLYVLVAVGFVCDKTGLYTEKAARLTNDLLFYIVTPAIIIQSFTTIAYTHAALKNLLLSFLGGTVLHIFALLIAWPFFRKVEKRTANVYKFACVYGNVGYMALPLASAVLGEEGVFFCSGVLIPFNIFAFTHGVRLMSGTSTEKTGFKMKWLLFNPGVISVLIGLPLFLLDVTLPRILAEPVSYIASLNTPLAMLMFGTYLAQTDLRKMFLRKETYLVALLKLIAVPSAMLLVMRLCGITGVLCTALTISASAPTANNTVMFATKYGRDTAAASQTVAVVSFLSVLTMPLFIAIAQL